MSLWLMVGWGRGEIVEGRIYFLRQGRIDRSRRWLRLKHSSVSLESVKLSKSLFIA